MLKHKPLPLSPKRVLFKMSGEVLMGDREFGLDPAVILRIAREIQSVYAQGVELAIVIGGGNIFRGVSMASSGMERSTADYMGMLATVMNALALQNALEQLDVPSRLMSAIPMPAVCEPYIRRRALRHLEKGRVVIFAAGAGVPYFTTDTAAALRASEMGCDLLCKGTKVQGVYSADPHVDANATFYPTLTYQEVLTQNLKVMDMSAITLARDNHIPIMVFSILEEGGLLQALKGESRYTLIQE